MTDLAVPSTVASLFAARARVVPRALAVADDRVSWSYRQLSERYRQQPEPAETGAATAASATT